MYFQGGLISWRTSFLTNKGKCIQQENMEKHS